MKIQNAVLKKYMVADISLINVVGGEVMEKTDYIADNTQKLELIDRERIKDSKTMTVGKMAKKYGIKEKSMQIWLRKRGIKPWKKQRKPNDFPLLSRTDNSYVKNRPEWERMRMRHFGSILEKAQKGADITKILDCYREVYGK